jgi:hypothetical protein
LRITGERLWTAGNGSQGTFSTERCIDMAPLYVMNLEDRVDLARNQLDLVILRLRRAVTERSRPDEVEQAVDSAATQLQHISELIGR